MTMRSEAAAESARWLGIGMSSFTAWFCTGSVTISMTSSTSITSISGVVLTSHIGSSLPLC